MASFSDATKNNKSTKRTTYYQLISSADDSLDFPPALAVTLNLKRAKKEYIIHQFQKTQTKQLYI